MSDSSEAYAIALIAPLTRDNAQYGNAYKTGLQVLCDEVNASGGINRIIRENGREGLILGSGCTLPGDLPYNRIASVGDACESYEEKERIYG